MLSKVKSYSIPLLFEC